MSLITTMNADQELQEYDLEYVMANPGEFTSPDCILQLCTAIKAGEQSMAGAQAQFDSIDALARQYMSNMLGVQAVNLSIANDLAQHANVQSNAIIAACVDDVQRGIMTIDDIAEQFKIRFLARMESLIAAAIDTNTEDKIMSIDVSSGRLDVTKFAALQQMVADAVSIGQVSHVVIQGLDRYYKANPERLAVIADRITAACLEYAAQESNPT